MPKALTDDERRRIEHMLNQGHTYREIAQTVGRSHGAIGRVAKSIGHRSGQTNLARAHEARSAYSAERRAVIAAKLTEAAEKLLEQLEEPHLVYNFGGSENVYREHELAEPDVQSKRQLVQAAREAMRTVLDIDRHDNRAEEGASAVDEWLRGMLRDEAP